ncbi:hypothetical protein ACOSQ4_005481 [Xanthoceras sorbifolium]
MDMDKCTYLIKSAWCDIGGGLEGVLVNIDNVTLSLFSWYKEKRVALKVNIKNKQVQLEELSANVHSLSWNDIRKVESELDGLLAKEVEF